ncbi:uncharacterized protein LOC122463502 [Chelonia mydas]|uniref:uncharacterized protein LOC122463502 n=1 Tax=Chelonia mydas TaxID=8469 RepID=UPI001CA8A0F2|nr:uncharacterized protein LOC122463502 [Chelonia mydas]
MFVAAESVPERSWHSQHCSAGSSGVRPWRLGAAESICNGMRLRLNPPPTVTGNSRVCLQWLGAGGFPLLPAVAEGCLWRLGALGSTHGGRELSGVLAAAGSCGVRLRWQGPVGVPPPPMAAGSSRVCETVGSICNYAGLRGPHTINGCLEFLGPHAAAGSCRVRTQWCGPVGAVLLPMVLGAPGSACGSCGVPLQWLGAVGPCPRPQWLGAPGSLCHMWQMGVLGYTCGGWELRGPSAMARGCGTPESACSGWELQGSASCSGCGSWKLCRPTVGVPLSHAAAGSYRGASKMAWVYGVLVSPVAAGNSRFFPWWLGPIGSPTCLQRLGAACGSWELQGPPVTYGAWELWGVPTAAGSSGGLPLLTVAGSCAVHLLWHGPGGAPLPPMAAGSCRGPLPPAVADNYGAPTG